MNALNKEQAKQLYEVKFHPRGMIVNPPGWSILKLFGLNQTAQEESAVENKSELKVGHYHALLLRVRSSSIAPVTARICGGS